MIWDNKRLFSQLAVIIMGMFLTRKLIVNVSNSLFNQSITKNKIIEDSQLGYKGNGSFLGKTFQHFFSGSIALTLKYLTSQNGQTHFNSLMPGSNKKIWELQVCLSMCDLFVTTRYCRVKNMAAFAARLWRVWSFWNIVL